MSHWQKRARLVIAVAGVAFAIVVAFAFRDRVRTSGSAPVAPADPKAVVQGQGGMTLRYNRDKEEIAISYKGVTTYQDGSSMLQDVSVVKTTNAGRTFTITAHEGRVADNESSITLAGDVHVTASDGLDVRTDRATYNENARVVDAPGKAVFSRGEMHGSGVGFAYEEKRDALTIRSQAAVHFAGTEAEGGGTDVTAGWAEISRPDRVVRFDRSMKASRADQVIESAIGVAYLAADEDVLERVELRGNARITGTSGVPGSLQSMTGGGIDLRYAPGGRAIQEAVVMNAADVRVTGEPGQEGRRIKADTRLTIGMEEDGSTIRSIEGRDGVEVTLPAEGEAPVRRVTADSFDASGRGGRGLTDATFSGRVRYREDPGNAANANRLDLVMKPGFGAIEEARFTGGVLFVDQKGMRGTAARAVYRLADDTLVLSGSESGAPAPHVTHEQVNVEAATIDIVLDGPVMKAAGTVKSILQPQEESGAKPGAAPDAKPAGGRRPSILENDRQVIVTADALVYDDRAGTAVYTGTAERPAQLTQGDTTIKGGSIAIDDENGDLSATAPVTTTIALQQKGKQEKNGGARERVASTATAGSFRYEESMRRATYTTDAHLAGPQGDLTADTIELYLDESADELERLEGYGSVEVRDDKFQAAGDRLTYTADTDQYVVTGKPVTVVDDCGGKSTGSRLTYARAEERFTITREGGSRAQTTRSTRCP